MMHIINYNNESIKANTYLITIHFITITSYHKHSLYFNLISNPRHNSSILISTLTLRLSFLELGYNIRQPLKRPTIQTLQDFLSITLVLPRCPQLSFNLPWQPNGQGVFLHGQLLA